MPTGLRQLFMDLVDNAVKCRGEGAAAVSERGIVLSVNRQLVDLLGRPRPQLVGSPAIELVGQEDRDAVGGCSMSLGVTC